MGQAKRRKDLGLMPQRTSKAPNFTRTKVSHPDYLGMGEIMVLLSSLMMGRHSGRNFAMRSEMARMNREEDETA